MRISGPPSELFAVIYAMRDAAGTTLPVRGSAGVGVAYVAVPDTTSAERVAGILTAARTVLLARGGGSCVVLRAPAPLRSLVDTYGPITLPDALWRAKAELDPEQRLAPGRLPDPT